MSSCSRSHGMEKSRDSKLQHKPFDPYSDYDYVYKVIIVGDSGVGKSSLLLRFSDGFFQEHYISTIGVDFRIRTVEYENKKIKLNVWDTAGQDRFKAICTQYYRGAHAVAIVFDVTDQVSFDHVTNWYKEVTAGSTDCVIILVGNKADKTKSRQISGDQAQALADSLNIVYMETSAKDDINVLKLFMTTVREVYHVTGGVAGLVNTKQDDLTANSYPMKPVRHKKGSILNCFECSLM